MEYRKLPEPSLFVDAALANFDEADWLMWQGGICVRRDNSLLLSLSKEEGGMCYFQDIQGVFPVDDHVIVVSSEGVFQWNGLKEPELLEQEVLPHLVYNQKAYCAWKDFRYRLWSDGREVLLPNDCVKPRLFPNQARVFWVYWGTIFLWDEHEEIQCFESIPEDYEQLIPLETGWLIALYEKKLLAYHSRFSKKRFDNEHIFDVVASVDASCLWILLVDGTLLEWNLDQEDEPEEIAFVEDAEGFVGEGLLLSAGEVLSFIP